MPSSDHARTDANVIGTCQKIDAPLTHPRSLSDLRSFLHGYRIKARSNGKAGRVQRASIIINLIDCRHLASPYLHRAARELAELDPSLSWLPGWKPRVAIQALRKGDGTEAVSNGESK